MSEINISSLPPEVTYLILDKVPLEFIPITKIVCKDFYGLSKDIEKKKGKLTDKEIITLLTKDENIHLILKINNFYSDNIEYALSIASEYGQLEMMKLAKDWGASDFDGALYDASKGGQLEAMELAKDWGASV